MDSKVQPLLGARDDQCDAVHVPLGGERSPSSPTTSIHYRRVSQFVTEFDAVLIHISDIDNLPQQHKPRDVLREAPTAAAPADIYRATIFLKRFLTELI